MSGMDFFGHQAAARRASGRLVWLFVLAVLGIIGSLYGVAHIAWIAAEQQGGFQPGLFALVALGTLAVVGIAMAFKTSQLRSGGGKVATMLGGTAVPLTPHDPKERMLRNLVEEMAIASGVPVPEIYVLDDEASINAFAAGWAPADAAVAVTRGCLEQLDRDELQGVIAHEFSHVFHGDMRLNIRLIGVLFGILCLATIGRILVRSLGRGSGNKKGGAAAIVLFGVGLIVIGYIGVLFARLIQAAVSRQREFLADASAVQYTRNPRGIGMALAKIGGITAPLRTPHAEEASHMLFADGVKRFFGGALATHPPIKTRIARVLPGLARELESASSLTAAVAKAPLPAGAAGFAGDAPAGARSHARGVAAAEVVASIGDVRAEHVQAAHGLLAALPLDLAAATHEPLRAKALVCAILLDRDPARREAQLRLLAPHGEGFVHEVRVALQAIARQDRALRLPLVELAMPALRAFPAAERAQLRRELRTLAAADGEVSPFEWALLRTVEHHVRAGDEPPARPPGRAESLLAQAPAAAVVLSMLAHAGAGGDDDAAARAFASGAAALGDVPAMAMLPRARASGDELERAVDALARVSPLGKRNLIAACAAAAGADGTLQPDETDLLRALATLWDCPVPLPPSTGIRS